MKTQIDSIDWQDIAAYLENHQIEFNALALNQIMSRHSDSLSKCQLYSKLRLAEEIFLETHNLRNINNIALCGGWVGVMISAILSVAKTNGVFPKKTKRIHSFDLDEDAIEIAKTLFKNEESFKVKNSVDDIYKLNYSNYDLIINPITEHIQDIDQWLDLIPKGKMLAMTNTNFTEPEDHINIKDNMNDFCSTVEQSIKVYKKITLEFPIYERYILIGEKIRSRTRNI